MLFNQIIPKYFYSDFIQSSFRILLHYGFFKSHAVCQFFFVRSLPGLISANFFSHPSDSINCSDVTILLSDPCHAVSYGMHFFLSVQLFNKLLKVDLSLEIPVLLPDFQLFLCIVRQFQVSADLNQGPLQ